MLQKQFIVQLGGRPRCKIQSTNGGGTGQRAADTMEILVGQMLQFSGCAVFCRLLAAAVRERPGAGLVNTGEQELGAGGWGAAILLMNPGLAAVSRGGGIL